MSDNADMSRPNTLAITYRPTKLKHFYGNETTVSIIKGMLENRRIPRAILFCGPTGSGKTTLARIVATAINEAETFRKSGTKYANCGSEGGVNDARGWLEEARFLPALNFQIFLLDEAQGLTKPAVDALLNQLESENSRAVWLLCSNEPDRLIATLKGRCKILTVRYPDEDAALRLMGRACDGEGYLQPIEKYERELKLFYRMSGGDPRVMLSGLSSFVDAFGKKPKPGSVDKSRIMELFQAPSSLQIDFPLVDYILTGKVQGIVSRIRGFIWRMDIKFTADLLKDLTTAMEKAVMEKSKDAVDIAKVCEKIGTAATKITGAPVMISAPLIYGAIIQSAMYMRDPRR